MTHKRDFKDGVSKPVPPENIETKLGQEVKWEEIESTVNAVDPKRTAKAERIATSFGQKPALVSKEEWSEDLRFLLEGPRAIIPELVKQGYSMYRIPLQSGNTLLHLQKAAQQEEVESNSEAGRAPYVYQFEIAADHNPILGRRVVKADSSDEELTFNYNDASATNQWTTYFEGYQEFSDEPVLGPSYGSLTELTLGPETNGIPSVFNHNMHTRYHRFDGLQPD